MSHICPKCGLPEELCVCESIAKETQIIEVKTVKRRFGKISTLISGIDPKSIGIKDVAKKLKTELACGGTVKDGVIELQGDHRQQVKKKLVDLGFSEDTIHIK